MRDNPYICIRIFSGREVGIISVYEMRIIFLKTHPNFFEFSYHL